MLTRHSRNPSAASLTGRMMWWLYNITLLVGVVLFCPLLIALAAGQKKRRQTFRQRLGWWRYAWQCPGQRAKPVIWVHALSVGEVTAAQPLVQGLEKQYGGHRIVLTASTLSGHDTACRLFADTGIELAFFPYDLIFSVRAMVKKVNPSMVILIETDIWPNFLCEMRRRQVPVFLSNFRMSDQTWSRCRAFKGVSSKIFQYFKKIYVQTAKDAQRIEQLGIASRHICETGNLKFDANAQQLEKEIEMRWRRSLGIGPDQTVIVAGSTHEGDEAVLAQAFKAIRQAGTNAMLIVAPRDPDRSRAIVSLFTDQGLQSRELSDLQNSPSPTCPEVVVVDFIGVLKELYALAALTFIGGSLSHEGGHNPLEPAIYGKPVVFGPDMRDFRQIAKWLLEMKGARQVTDGVALGNVILELLNHPETAKTMGLQARAVFEKHQGAVAKTLGDLSLDGVDV